MHSTPDPLPEARIQSTWLWHLGERGRIYWRHRAVIAGAVSISAAMGLMGMLLGELGSYSAAKPASSSSSVELASAAEQPRGFRMKYGGEFAIAFSGERGATRGPFDRGFLPTGGNTVCQYYSQGYCDATDYRSPNPLPIRWRGSSNLWASPDDFFFRHSQPRVPEVEGWDTRPGSKTEIRPSGFSCTYRDATSP